MCGLFGGFGTSLDASDKENIRMLGVLSKTRGDDSTGIFTVKRQKKKGTSAGFTVRMHKDILPSTTFLDTKMAIELIKDNPFVIAGHTRFATHGTVRAANAHPFIEGHYVGMHNGVIAHYFDQKNDLTDSAVLFKKFTEDGPVGAIQEACADDGSMALVFVDKSQNTLNMFRNNGRPLFLGAVKGKKVTYWASEKWMLDTLESAGMCSFTAIVSLKPDILNTMDLKTLQVKTTPVLLDKKKPPTRSFLPPGYRPGIDFHQDMACAYRNRSNDDGPDYERYVGGGAPGMHLRSAERIGKVSTIIGPTPPTPLVVTRPVLSLPEKDSFNGIRYVGYKGLIMSIADVTKIIKTTECCSCTSHATGLLSPIYWLGEKKYVCKDCFPDLRGILFREEDFTIGWVRRRDGTPFVRKVEADGEVPF